MRFPSFTQTFHRTAYEALDVTLPALSARNKNVVITGGGTGIGSATALRFAQAEASSVSIIGRRAAPLESTKAHIQQIVPSARILTYTSDVTKKDSLAATFQAIYDHVGPIDVLVSSAGYIPKPALVKDAEEGDWWRCFEVNVKGTFLTTQAFLPLKATDAVLIYVTSGLSHLSGGPYKSAYAASKAGTVRFLTTVQLEHPELRVISLHPGVIQTESLKKSGNAVEGDNASLPAATMVWLASPEADFLKGKYVWANWDVPEMKARAREIAGSDLLTMKLAGWPFT